MTFFVHRQNAKYIFVYEQKNPSRFNKHVTIWCCLLTYPSYSKFFSLWVGMTEKKKKINLIYYPWVSWGRELRTILFNPAKCLNVPGMKLVIRQKYSLPNYWPTIFKDTAVCLWMVQTHRAQQQQTQTTTGSARRWLRKTLWLNAAVFALGWRYKGGSHKDKNRC